MIKFPRHFILLLSLSFQPLGAAVAADNIPSDESGTESFANLRLFQKIKKFNALIELSHAQLLDDLNPTSIRVGGKYRLSKSFKLGLYLKRENSQRHVDDWTKNSGSWQWTDTSERSEHVSQLELLWRTQWGRAKVFELRNMYEYNHFNQQQTFKLRPGLTYFVMKDGRPLMNIFTQLEAYFALNFSEKLIYEQWAYLGVLYHLHKKISLGPLVGHRSRVWTNSQDAKNRGVPEYESTFKSWFIGLNLVMRDLF